MLGLNSGLQGGPRGGMSLCSIRQRWDFPEKTVFIILQTEFLIDQFPSFGRLLESLGPNLKEVTWSSQLLLYIQFLLLLLAPSWFPICIFSFVSFFLLILNIIYLAMFFCNHSLTFLKQSELSINYHFETNHSTDSWGSPWFPYLNVPEFTLTYDWLS